MSIAILQKMNPPPNISRLFIVYRITITMKKKIYKTWKQTNDDFLEITLYSETVVIL